MASGEKTFHSHRVSKVAELDSKWIDRYWAGVELCLRKVFRKSDTEARKAAATMRARTDELSEPATLLLYHDSPLQVAAILAGASDRGLTEEELLAYDKLWPSDSKDRPTREQILQVHKLKTKAG